MADAIFGERNEDGECLSGRLFLGKEWWAVSATRASRISRAFLGLFHTRHAAKDTYV